MKFEVSADEQGYEVCITEAYQGLTIDTERSGKLHICHRDGGIEVWEAKAGGALLWSSTDIDEKDERIRELKAENKKKAGRYNAVCAELDDALADNARLREAMTEAYDWCAHKGDTQMCEETLRAALEGRGDE